MGPRLAQGLLVLVLALSLVLAGCLGGPSEDEMEKDGLPSEYDTPQYADEPAEGDPPLEDPPTDPAAATPDPNSTTEGTNATTDESQQEEEDEDAPAHTGPPEAELVVLNNTGGPTDKVLGAAPLDVRFHLDAKVFDGAIPYWSLRLSGSDKPLAEGNRLPAKVDHRIIDPGNYTAILFVSDGGGRDEQRVDIEVQRPPPPPPVRFEGTVTGFWTGDDYVGEKDSHSFDLDIPVRKINATLKSGTTAFDLDYVLVAPDGTTVERRVDFFPAEEDPIVVTDPEFTHQLGSWTLYVMPALSVNGEYGLEVTFN